MNPGYQGYLGYPSPVAGGFQYSQQPMFQNIPSQYSKPAGNVQSNYQPNYSDLSGLDMSKNVNAYAAASAMRGNVADSCECSSKSFFYLFWPLIKIIRIIHYFDCSVFLQMLVILEYLEQDLTLHIMATKGPTKWATWNKAVNKSWSRRFFVFSLTSHRKGSVCPFRPSSPAMVGINPTFRWRFRNNNSRSSIPWLSCSRGRRWLTRTLATRTSRTNNPVSFIRGLTNELLELVFLINVYKMVREVLFLFSRPCRS